MQMFEETKIFTHKFHVKTEIYEDPSLNPEYKIEYEIYGDKAAVLITIEEGKGVDPVWVKNEICTAVYFQVIEERRVHPTDVIWFIQRGNAFARIPVKDVKAVMCSFGKISYFYMKNLEECSKDNMIKLARLYLQS